jgi:predicted  nucleic acid-binding Zn-ribbon protein
MDLQVIYDKIEGLEKKINSFQSYLEDIDDKIEGVSKCQGDIQESISDMNIEMNDYFEQND